MTHYIHTQKHLISIITDDVNNKGPIFNQDTLLPIMIMENVKSGYFVRQVLANDPDLTAKLEFRIDYNASEGRNENGILVPNLNISEIFSIEKDKGDIEVIGNLDREITEQFKLMIVVEDVNADLEASQFRPQIQRSSLFIMVQDVNDNQPAFKGMN